MLGRTARRAALRILPPTVIFVALMITWEGGLYHRLFDLEIYTVPYPSAMLSAFVDSRAALLRELGNTFIPAGIGYGLGSIVGIGLAFVISEVDPLRRYLLPTASSFSAMPVLATAPLMVLYLGLGFASAVAVVVLMVVPPTLISVYKGLSSIEVDSHELLESIATPHLLVLIKLKIPKSLPFMFTSLKLNVTLALVGVIVTEFLIVQRGLGAFMTRNLETFNMPVAWMSMVIVAVLGVIWFQVVQVIERFTIPWHASIRESS